MAVEERVVIHVDIESDVAKDVATINAALAAIGKGKNGSRDLSDMDGRSKKLDRTLKNTTRTAGRFAQTVDKLKNSLKSAGRVLGNFLSKFSLFSFIGVAIEIGLISIALLSVKLALVSGRLALQAYQATLTGLGVAAGGVAVALGSVAAAMRQINEVTLAPNIGGVKKSAQAMRSAMSDQMLSFYGMEGVQTAVTALAKGGVNPNAGYTGILKQLGDYTSDPKQLADLAGVYAEITSSGTVSGESLGKLTEINPALAAGISELSGLTGEALEKAMGEGGAGVGADVFNAVIAGQAKATDAWEGQLARMNNTVVGTLKGMIPRLFSLFADLGEPFLATIQQTLTSIEHIVTKTIFRIRGTVTGFGLEKMIPGLLGAFEKIADWLADIVNESLPKVEGFVEKMTSWWDTVRNWAIDMARIFQPLEAAADVLMDVLAPQFGGIFDGFAMLIKNFADSLTQNRGAFIKFGEAINRFILSFFSFFDNANSRFVEALPVWSDLLDTLTTDVVPALTDLFDLLHEASLTVLPAVTTALSAVAAVISSVSGALKGLLNIPGIGMLLGLMMFKTTRRPMMALGRGVMGLGAGGAAAGGGGGAAAGGVAAGGAAAGGGYISRALARQIPLGGWGMRGVMAGVPGAMGMGATAAAPASMSIGAALGTTLLPAVGGFAGGTFIGDRVAGTGGILGGIGLGAGAGAGIGTGVGLATTGGLAAPVTAAIGAVLGGITGGIGAYMAQGRQKGIKEAAESLMDGFYEEIEMNLSKGQGRAAIEAAKSEMTQMLNDVAETAKELGVNEGELRKELTRQSVRLNGMAEKATRDLDNRVSFLSDSTGIAADEIERLADVMGINLVDATGRMIDQYKQFMGLSDWDLTEPGVAASTNSVLYDNLFGPGSAFEQKYLAPETYDTYAAYANEAKDVIDAGGVLDSSMVRNLIDAQMAAYQATGMTGSEIIESMLIDVPALDTLIGAGGGLTTMMPDIEKTITDLYDPSQNAQLGALRTATFDWMATSLEHENTYRTDPLEFQKKVDEAFEGKLQNLKDAPIKDFDKILGQLLGEVGANMPFDTTEMDGMVLRTSEYLKLFGDQLETERIRLAGGDPSTRPGGHGPGAIPTGRGTPGIGTPSNYSGPSNVLRPSTNISATANQTYKTQNQLNVYGLAMDEAIAKVEEALRKAARNQQQRNVDALPRNIRGLLAGHGG